MPTYERAFPAHSKPWLARITSWPDNSPPAMTFGKRVKGAATPTITIEVSENDILRWGAKDANGDLRPDVSGFGLWQQGKLWPLSKEEAQMRRRIYHPEDASAAPIRGTFGRKRGTSITPPTPPGATSPVASPTTTVDATAYAQVIAHLQALVRTGEHLADAVAQHGPAARSIQTAIVQVLDLLPGARGALSGIGMPAATRGFTPVLGTSPAPVPAAAPAPAEPVEPEEPEAMDDAEEPAAIPLDKDGLPLF